MLAAGVRQPVQHDECCACGYKRIVGLRITTHKHVSAIHRGWVHLGCSGLLYIRAPSADTQMRTPREQMTLRQISLLSFGIDTLLRTAMSNSDCRQVIRCQR